MGLEAIGSATSGHSKGLSLLYSFGTQQPQQAKKPSVFNHINTNGIGGASNAHIANSGLDVYA